MQTFYYQPGFWLALLAGLLMYVNAVRTLINPIGFSKYMGLPVDNAAGTAWVQVYGLRALFIGLLVTYFLVRLDPGSLQWLTGFAVSMAVGDAALVRRSGGTAARRHLIIAAVLIASTVAVHRWSVVSQ